MALVLGRLAVFGRILAKAEGFPRIHASQRQIASSCCCAAADNLRSSEQSWVRRILQGSGPSRDADDTLEEEDIVEVEPQYLDIVQTPKAAFIERPQTRKRSYQPPADLPERLREIILEAVPETAPDAWQDVALTSNDTKYRVLLECSRAFGHDVPNFLLSRMRTAGDLAGFYASEVKDASRFDQLSAARLPPNLKIHWDYGDDSRLELYRDHMELVRPRSRPKPPDWKFRPS